MLGRIGVTFIGVEEAAHRLQGQGRMPTVDSIREILGTGSKTTIARHLKAWRAKQLDNKGKLPHELLALVAGLWEQLQVQAAIRISEVETRCNNALESIEQSLSRTQQELIKVQLAHQESSESLKADRLSKSQLEQKYQDLHQEHISLTASYKTQSEQITEIKQEKSRLHQLSNHFQANLEHYQNAMQQLRAEQSLEIEKQYSLFQQDIAALRYQLTDKQKEKESLIQQLAEQSREIQLLQAQHEHELVQHEKLTTQWQAAHSEAIRCTERYNTYQKIVHTNMKEIAHKNELIIDAEKKMAVFSDQVQRLEKELSFSINKIETLRQEHIQLQEYIQKLEHISELQRDLNENN